MLGTGYTAHCIHSCQGSFTVLYRGAGPRNLSNNYRPISITSLLIRTHERLLAPYYRKCILQLISAYQHGFRPGQSTQDSIHRTVEHVYRAINSKSYSAVLLLDLAKAFDTVWVDGLLYILRTQFNIRGRAWLFIKAFLTNRSLRVVSTNLHSMLQHIFAGVPQGSMLAPLLCLVFIDRLSWKVSPCHTGNVCR